MRIRSAITLAVLVVVLGGLVPFASAPSGPVTAYCQDLPDSLSGCPKIHDMWTNFRAVRDSLCAIHIALMEELGTVAVSAEQDTILRNRLVTIRNKLFVADTTNTGILAASDSVFENMSVGIDLIEDMLDGPDATQMFDSTLAASASFSLGCTNYQDLYLSWSDSVTVYLVGTGIGNGRDTLETGDDEEMAVSFADLDSLYVVASGAGSRIKGWVQKR